MSLRFRISGLGVGVAGFGVRVEDLRFEISVYRVSGFGFMVKG